MRVPQKILDAIIWKIGREDLSMLAACTLVASNLREQSQQILLETGESPHIASYVTELRLEIPFEDDPRSPDSSATEFEDFSATDTRSILACLTNVHLCLFTGVHNGGYYTHWCNIPPDLAAAYSEIGNSSANIHSANSPRIRMQGLCDFLARPQYAPLSRSLIHLGITGTEEVDEAVEKHIRNAARTLVTLRIWTVYSHRITSPFPCFPSLSSLEYFRYDVTFDDPRWVNGITAFLCPTATPKLAQITIGFNSYSEWIPLGWPIPSKSDAMARLDDALASHFAIPYLKLWWQFNRYSLHRPFNDFRCCAQEAMPRARARGRLIVEHTGEARVLE
ncbi:hypothetical protein B0H14DRAFT_2571043 [Mycena olivaceomarginata]|nr:hypothetical protein B0H14DRAFT_2571043 [Mycena olivaceomarginata]